MNFFTAFPWIPLSRIIVLGSLAPFTFAFPSVAASFDFSTFADTGDATTSINGASISTSTDTIAAENFSGNGAVSEADLTNFLSGVNSGDLDGSNFFFDTAREGSAIQQNNFSVSAGETISFDWTFFTNETPPDFGTIGDYAFVVIDGTVERLFELNADGGDLTSSGTAYASQASGTFTRTFSTAQTFDFAIGVVDIQDTSNSSGFQVSNTSTTAVPFEVEGTMGLAFLGAFIWYRSRKKRKQALSQQSHN